MELQSHPLRPVRKFGGPGFMRSRNRERLRRYHPTRSLRPTGAGAASVEMSSPSCSKTRQPRATYPSSPSEQRRYLKPSRSASAWA